VAALLRVCSRTAGSTAKLASGSKPSAFFSPATSSAPSLAPWTEWWPALVGSGQPMMVVSLMNDGLSVTDFAASMASYSAWMSSS